MINLCWLFIPRIGLRPFYLHCMMVDIVQNGIYLAGSGALLRGLDKRLQDKIGIKFHVAEDPLLSVAKGVGIALQNIDRYPFLMR